jgi:hypothetical protein
MFCMVTNIYNKKIKESTLMELFTATGKLNFFLTTRDVRCVHHTWHGTQYVPPLPRDLTDLKAQIIAAMKNINAPMLMRVWQELEYCIDVCRVTRGAHVEHL